MITSIRVKGRKKNFDLFKLITQPTIAEIDTIETMGRILLNLVEIFFEKILSTKHPVKGRAIITNIFLKISKKGSGICSWRKKYINSGVTNGDTKVVIKVSITASTTFDFDKYDITFAAVPPGHADTIINPVKSDDDKQNILPKVKAIMGISKYFKITITGII